MAIHATHSADLLFEFPQQGRTELVFGEGQATAQQVQITVLGSLPGLRAEVVFIPPAELSLVAALPSLSGQLDVRLAQPVSVVIGLPALKASVEAAYESNTTRPTVAQQRNTWRIAEPSPVGWTQLQQVGRRTVPGWQARWEGGQNGNHGVAHPLPPTQEALHRTSVDVFDAGSVLHRNVGFAHAQATTTAQRLASAFEAGSRSGRRVGLPYQEATRIRSHNPRAPWQSGSPRTVLHPSTMDKASPLLLGAWSLYQEGMPPPPGLSRPTVPEPPAPSTCYTPSATLWFSARAGAGPHLLFVCDHATEPPANGPVFLAIQRIYLVINDCTLKRVSDQVVVPTLSMSLRLDAGSWVWGFEAGLPGAAQALVEPTNAGPVELSAWINGTEFRVLAESLSRERTFGQTMLRVSGRGRQALLDAPYAATMSFTNSDARTHQQLFDDVLTLNGIPLGWSIDYGLEAWNVPAGVFTHQGTFISALATLARAGGAYLIPHPSAMSFQVRPLYPLAPWHWGEITPDFVLPAAAMSRESIAWKDKPAYNRVFVSGQEQGVIGQVTRAGSAGDLLAPMVTDPLITTAAAARQRGLSILSDTGRQLEIGLRLPVLPSTGIIRPGAYVQYEAEGQTQLGLVRSTNVEVGLPEVHQSLGVECHA